MRAVNTPGELSSEKPVLFNRHGQHGAEEGII